MARRQRLLIIGLDGATWDIINPLIALGKLPHIAGLVMGGASCALRSTMPPITPPAWATMLTGVNPGKHGVFGFSRRLPGTYDYQGTTNRSRRVEALWNIVSRRGGDCLLINIPVTYPPDEVKGVMVAGMGTPDAASEFVYPHSEKENLLAYCPGYRVDISGRVDSSDVLALCMEEISQRSMVTRWLMSRHNWDLCMTVFVAPDRVQHARWQEGAIADDIAAVYAALDGAIGELLQKAGNECTVMLVSDHGFGPASLALSASNWLQQRGLGSPQRLVANLLGDAPPGMIPDSSLYASSGSLACVDPDAPDAVRLVTTAPDHVARLTLPDLVVEPHSALQVKLHVYSSQPGMILEVMDLSTVGGQIIFTCRLAAEQHEITFSYRPVSEHLHLSLGLTTFGGNPSGELRLSAIEIDFMQRLTGALAFTGNDVGSIHLNLRGRDPAGVVLPGIEEANLKQRIVQELSAWHAAGQPVVSEAHVREEIFTGPYVQMAPDIVFWSDHLRPLRTQPGTHRFDGVFVAHGPGIAPGRLQRSQIADVMPTALYLLGQAIPQGLDGKVLTAMLDANYLTQHPVQLVDDQTSLAAVAPATYTASEQAILEERLRNLGYVE